MDVTQKQTHGKMYTANYDERKKNVSNTKNVFSFIFIKY